MSIAETLTTSRESASFAEASFWQAPTAAVLAGLATTGGGLSSPEAASRLSRWGRNDAAAPKRAPAWKRVLRRFANPLVIILLAERALRRDG